MDTAEQAAFHVHKLDSSGSTVFEEHESGLYLHDASVSPAQAGNVTNEVVIAYSCLQTIAENKKAFTKRQVNATDEAHKLYCMMG